VPLFGNEHRGHAACGRACVPAFLHREFVKLLGGPDPDRRLRAWYDRVLGAMRDDEPQPADVLKFWRQRYDAEFVKPTVIDRPDEPRRAVPSAEATRALIDNLKNFDPKGPVPA